MPTTSPLKRPSGGGGGRLRRLLASLRPPARAGGPLPVQTGFPTSLADIVVKNHGRLRNPRRRHCAAAPPPAAAAEPAPVVAQRRRELSVDHDAAAEPARAPVTARPGKGAGFSIRPGILAAGVAVALVLLVIWSKELVAAATIASVAMSWIESVRTARDRRPETEEEVDSPRGRGCVSPIREKTESPRPVSGEGVSDDGGYDATSFWSVHSGDDSPSPASSPKRKQSRRSLRKLLAGKLRNGMTPRGTDSRHSGDAGEHERPATPRRLSAEPVAATVPAEETPAAPQEAITVNNEDRCHRRCRGALPLPALVPIILAGLVAGKLPALALAVLCAAFSSSVESVPVPPLQQGSR